MPVLHEKHRARQPLQIRAAKCIVVPAANVLLMARGCVEGMWKATQVGGGEEDRRRRGCEMRVSMFHVSEGRPIVAQRRVMRRNRV